MEYAWVIPYTLKKSTNLKWKKHTQIPLYMDCCSTENAKTPRVTELWYSPKKYVDAKQVGITLLPGQ